jgi:hypothetical protein
MGTGFGLTPQVGFPIGFNNARNQMNFLDGTQITITVDISLLARIGNSTISVNNAGKFAFATFIVNGPYYMVVQTDTGQTVLCDGCKTTVRRTVLYQVLNFDLSIASGTSVCEVVAVNSASYSCTTPATFPGFDTTKCTAPLVLGTDGLFEDDWGLNDTFTPVGCGLTDVDTWQWAGSAASLPQVLGTLNGVVETNLVTINGIATKMTPGTVIPH